MTGILDQLRNKGILRGYESHVLGLEPILGAMSHRGILVDNAARLELATELQASQDKVFEEMQDFVPESLRDIHPKEGYKREPKDVMGMVQREFAAELRWVKILPFKPSSPQLIRYMKAKGHPVPRHSKEDRDTTEAKHLLKLAKDTRDPLYAKVLEYRELEKMRATYVEGWEPAADGRVHPTFLFRPATGQLSCIKPNAQNFPIRPLRMFPELPKRLRRMIVASPGHVLLSFDFKAFHALTLGFEARDASYMRLARMDIHSFLASELLKLKRADLMLGMQDEELADYLGWVKANHKEVRDGKAKPTILAYGFGEQAYGLWKQNEDTIRSKKEAQAIIDTLDGAFPKTARWRKDIVEVAHRGMKFGDKPPQPCLVSRHGYIRYFWEVKQWNAKKRCWGWGPDSTAAIAFLPANDAFGHKKDAMLRLDARGWLGQAGLVNEIHDDLLFDCPEELAEEAMPTIKTEMEQPSEVLVDPDVAPQGLVCEVEMKRGRNWAEMEEVRP